MTVEKELRTCLTSSGLIKKPETETMGNTYRYYFGNGYVKFTDGLATLTPQYFFYSKDHLGRSTSRKGGAFIAKRRKNVRSVVTKNPNTNEITEVQQTHYYPFGGIIADLGTGRSVQNHLYNGKELDTSNNLWWYDYGARQYDPTRGQFTNYDQHCESYYNTNPLTYCGNNPISRIDPDGRDVYITGKNISGAIEALANAAGSGLSLEHNSLTGSLCYTIVDREKLGDNAKIIIKAIDNCDIDVELRTIDTNKYTNLAVIGGSYFGASFQDGTAKAVNVVNPKVLSKMDAFSPKGTSMMHELSESYNGALDALENKKSYPASFCPGSNYEKAHNSATPQPDLRYYEVDKDGNMTLDHNTAIGQRIYVTDGIKTSTVIDWNYEKNGKIE